MRQRMLLLALASFVVAAVVGGAGGCQSTGDRAAADASSADASAGAGSGGGRPADVPRVAADLVEQHCDGLRKKDVAALEKLWADDFTFVNPRGQVLSKADRLKNVRTGATEFKSLTCSEASTKSWGNDWAVTTMRAVIEGQYSGQEGSGDYRCSFVWAQPHGRWQLVGLQMTRIDK
jgi:ketosteroid isomerase-like protein